MAGCVLGGADACVADVITSGLESLAKGFADSASNTTKQMSSMWLKTPGPNLDGPGSVAVWLQGQTAGLIFAAAFLSVLWCAYRMAVSGTFDHLAELGLALAKLVLVTGLTVVVTTAALMIGEAWSVWIMAGVDPKLSAGIVLAVKSSPALTILLSTLVILAQVVQAMLMIVKNAMVVLLVGFLPLTSAATNTPLGRGSFHKALTWLAAFVLYKPVAATIYAASYKLADRDKGIAEELSGLVLMVLSILALPALMRFLVPVTAAASGGNAGAIAGATVGATIATGATLAAGAASGGAGFAAAPAIMQSAPSGAAMGSAAASGAVPRDESER